MPNILDQFMNSLRATPLVQSLQQTAPVQGIQNWITQNAIQNPALTSNILNATGGSFGNLYSNAVKAGAQALFPQAQLAATVAGALRPQQVQAAVRPVSAVTPTRPAAVAQTFGQLNQRYPANARIAAAPTPNPQGPAQTNINPGVASGPTGGGFNTTYDQMLASAKEAVRPYYEQILKDSNWNIDEAKKKLEEDYQQGLRNARSESDVATRDLFNQTIPQEQLSTAENLNRRGLLTTPTGVANQLTGQLTTGEQIGPDNPYLRQSYGGLAGGTIQRMQASQQARGEAIGRALSQREAELQLPVTQQTRQLNYQAQQQPKKIAGEQELAANQLAGEKYANSLGLQKTALGSIYT